jgi:peptide-methionine (S)-S-oxide reductase
MGPDGAPENPTYRQVCNGDSGHVEVFYLEYQGGPKYYEELVKFFFQFHDPTTMNRQGNDRGTQYASVIYCYTNEQYEIALRVKGYLQDLLNSRKLGSKVYSSSTVTTDIRQSTIFYPAHDEHQDYLTVNPNGYCNHRIRFQEWPSVPGTASGGGDTFTSSSSSSRHGSSHHDDEREENLHASSTSNLLNKTELNSSSGDHIE